jgi:hypothetical protein
VWEASQTGSDVRTLSIVYPHPDGTPAPTVTTTDRSITLIDGDWQSEAIVGSEGELVIVETKEGVERLRYAERGTDLRLAVVSGEGRFVESRGAGEAEWLLRPTPEEVTIEGLPFEVATLDGACEARVEGERLVVRTGGVRFGVRETVGNGRPAAVATAGDGAVGDPIVLDGSGSCDPEGSALEYAWSLVAAPAGSRWLLDEASSTNALLTPDAPGIYRVALRVTDSLGAKSDPAFAEVEVKNR